MSCPKCEGTAFVEVVQKYVQCMKCNHLYEASLIPIQRKVTDITWDIVDEQMAINSKDRLNWRAILGCSLNKKIAQLRSEGKTTQQIYDWIVSHHQLNQEQIRRLRIGIASRIGESNICLNELKKNDIYKRIHSME